MSCFSVCPLKFLFGFFVAFERSSWRTLSVYGIGTLVKEILDIIANQNVTRGSLEESNLFDEILTIFHSGFSFSYDRLNNALKVSQYPHVRAIKVRNLRTSVVQK
ncbi:hypothetical protein M514_25076 [Trichuris suis]|uniref:Uncharacterized protein n=1 Tax=Trichuris suis TaxID=68888 RepID=A0A085N000_9BILA|nr:hypothetical protein M514_25076 [Trichuris suis]